jgi:beta-glucosidase
MARRAVIGWKFNQTSRVGQMMTDMLVPTDPEGLYYGIQLMAKLGVPIYITETGIADATGQNREQFFNEYFGQVRPWVSEALCGRHRDGEPRAGLSTPR